MKFANFWILQPPALQILVSVTDVCNFVKPDGSIGDGVDIVNDSVLPTANKFGVLTIALYWYSESGIKLIISSERYEFLFNVPFIITDSHGDSVISTRLY